MSVHSELGPGLVEKAYDVSLRKQLTHTGLQYEHQLWVSLKNDGQHSDLGFRLDYVVHECVVVEINAVEKIHPLHVAQLLSYLKMGHCVLCSLCVLLPGTPYSSVNSIPARPIRLNFS